jgi:hypothetical protein
MLRVYRGLSLRAQIRYIGRQLPVACGSSRQTFPRPPVFCLGRPARIPIAWLCGAVAGYRGDAMGSSAFDYEVLTSAELAQRLKVKESWVVDQSKRSRTSDPIPVFRLGKHRRYRWGSPELNAWLDRRAGYNTQQRKAGSSRNGGTM